MKDLNKNQFTVWVRCMTFNHAPFITNALNGFAMQQTSFPFVCTIIDDASTDGEQDIIKSYLEEHFDISDSSVALREETDDYYLVFGRHKNNKNCFFAVYFLKYNHYSIKKSKMPYLAEWADIKYISLCEGDDWWTNPSKLQMQVSYLEVHPDYVLCYGDVKRIDTDHNRPRGSINQLSRRHNKNETPSKEQRFYRVLNGYYHIQTMTALYRSSAVKNRPQQKHQFMMGDTNLWLHLSQQGNFHYFEENFGIYNIHHGSATHSPKTRTRFTLSKYEMRCYYCEVYGYEIPKKIKKLYNRAYINLILKNDIISPQPIYEPFYRNKMQWWILQQIVKKGIFAEFYKKVLHPIKKRCLYFSIQMGLVYRMVKNMVF